MGQLLTDHMKREGLSQTALANTLGISQSYLSRILHGQRSAVSLSLWDKVLKIVPRPELFVVDDSVTGASDAYDRSLIAIGAGNRLLAEILLGQVTDRPITSAAGADLVVKAKFQLAGIRRDRFQITGSAGAHALYIDAMRYYRRNTMRARIEETLFMLGACKEMSNDPAALATYNRLLDRLERAESTIAIRVSGRVGALATKLGDYELASCKLEFATQASIHLDDSTPYSYYHEKLAILRTHQGFLDQAYANLRTARAEIAPGDILRRVQSTCVESNILVAGGETDDAKILLQKAWKLATQHEYIHQQRYIEGLMMSLSPSGKPPAMDL